MVESSMRPLSVERLRHPEARWLLGYWREKAAQVGLPAEDAFNAEETRAVAPHLMLLQPVGGAGELRYEAVGSAIVERFGSDLTGMILRPGATGPGWVSIILQAAAEQRPRGLGGRVVGSGAGWIEFEAVALPLECVRDDREGTSILVGLFFFDR